MGCALLVEQVIDPTTGLDDATSRHARGPGSAETAASVEAHAAASTRKAMGVGLLDA